MADEALTYSPPPNACDLDGKNLSPATQRLRLSHDPGLANKATDTLMKANTSFPVEMTLYTLMEAWSFWRSIWKRPDLTLKGHQLTFTENLLCARGSSHNIPFNPHQKVVSTISLLY